MSNVIDTPNPEAQALANQVISTLMLKPNNHQARMVADTPCATSENLAGTVINTEATTPKDSANLQSDEDARSLAAQILTHAKNT